MENGKDDALPLAVQDVMLCYNHYSVKLRPKLLQAFAALAQETGECIVGHID